MTNADRQHLESLLGFPPLLDSPLSGMRSLEELVPGGWPEVVALDAICKRAQSAVEIRSNYRQAEIANTTIRWSQKFFVSGYRFHQYSILQVGLANPRLWEQTVANKGIEIIDGKLILAVLSGIDDREQTEGEVLIAQQGRGLTVVPAIARVSKNKTGEWIIQEPVNKKHPGLEILCHSVRRGNQPDDPIWQASLFARMIDASRSFEESVFDQTPRSVDADGSHSVN